MNWFLAGVWQSMLGYNNGYNNIRCIAISACVFILQRYNSCIFMWSVFTTIFYDTDECMCLALFFRAVVQWSSKGGVEF